MPTTKPTAGTIEIKKVRRTRKLILIAYHHGKEDQSLRSPQNPLPAFNSSLDALPPLVCRICGLPASYADKMTVTGLTIAGDAGSESIMIIAKKDLADNNRPFNIATPLRPLDEPESQEGEASPKSTPLSADDLKLIDAVIAAAKDYVLGKRAQGELNFEAGGEEGDEGEGADKP